MITRYIFKRLINETDKILLTILFIVFLFMSPIDIFGQPCGPKIRLIDKQIITPEGDLILFYSWFGGELMMCGEPKGISLNYVLISEKGKVKKDTEIYLKWPEWHYDFMSCQANYKNISQIDNEYIKTKNKEVGYYCANYLFYSLWNKLVLGYFLTCDRKLAYEIIIDKTGKSKWEIYNLDTLDLQSGVSSHKKYSDDSTKFIFWEKYLKTKYKKLRSLPQEQFEFNTKKNEIKLKDKDIYLSEVQCDTIEDRLSQQAIVPNKWKVKGVNWTIPLDGSLFPRHILNNNNSPLITIKNNFLYVTVFNMDGMSCHGYGWDITPIVYCIDFNTRSILWKQILP